MAKSTSTSAAARDDARAATLSKFITKATRKDPGAIFTFNDGRHLAVPVVPTGALSLDFTLGVGGMPRGRIIEIYGPESAGKTSLALSIAAQAIKAGGMAGLIDAEHAITPDHITSMGVNGDYFAISQPDSGEDALAKLEDMVKEGIFDVLIVDSVAALVPQAELDGEMADMQVGAQARLMSRALRRLSGSIQESNAVVIFINQLREKIGGYGNPETTPGGRALKFYASVRLSVRAAAGDRIKDPKNSKEFIGLGTTVTVVKNKVAAPQKKAEYNLIWGKGIDAASSVFDVAKNLGVLVEQGGYSYANAITGEQIVDAEGKLIRGKDKIKEYLSANTDVANEIAEGCRLQMQQSAVPVEALPDDVFVEDGTELAVDVA